MYSCKLTYSIGEIAGLMDKEPEEVRDALVAAGVRMMLRATDADLSRWPTHRVQQRPGGSLTVPDIALVPSPDDLLVLVDDLPQSWQSHLRAERMNQMLSEQATPEYRHAAAGVEAALDRLDDAKANFTMMTEALANAPKTGDVGKIREAQAAVDSSRQDVERAQTCLERLRGDSEEGSAQAMSPESKAANALVRRNPPVNPLSAVIDLAREQAANRDDWTRAC